MQLQKDRADAEVTKRIIDEFTNRQEEANRQLEHMRQRERKCEETVLALNSLRWP
jgi:hypothetical protein